MNERRQTTSYENQALHAPEDENGGSGAIGENPLAVKFENVSFSYGEEEKEALHRVSLEVKQGEFVAILGHNGSGKSTLARLINGLLTPTEGKIAVLGMDAGDKKNLFEIRKNAGIVFQNPDNQTVASIVEDDVAFGPENIGVPREEIGGRIDFALNAVGMQPYRRAETARLSGGQKQRVAIAGVLALMPKIMILDESTAMLDPKGRREVTETVKRLNRENGITVISITHFPEEAAQADRAIVLNRGEVALQGTPDEVLKSEEQLLTFNLTLPRCVKICRELRGKGMNVPDALRAEEIAEEILNNPAKRPFEKSAENMFAAINGADERKNNEFAVECADLYFSYDGGEEHALNGVNLNIKKGDFFGIIGHTGSGKSTFARHLNALEKLPTAQKKYKPKKEKKRKKQAGAADTAVAPHTVLNVNGYDLSDKNTDFFALRSSVGMVFQYPEYQLFAETVFADVAFGLKNFSKTPLSEAETARAVKEALEKVGLSYEEVKDKSPFELSGGQKRRVAIAGVIVTKPKILVLDEPAAGLDPLGKEEIAALLKRVHEDWCETVIVVSHDMDEIAELCNRAAVFSEGKAVFCDSPERLFTQHAEELLKLGLDIPETAKIQRELRSRGVNVQSDLTLKGFVNAAAQAMGYGESRETGGPEE
ncbi:MAG: energy-coupling factor transporter ATPase [Candidatus Borkfalkiaceae bacterium]|nr:energy-coupling factor transporter ATPase [Clostridia bacterium]MDY6224072.1 energy-coupling factor transporter ATPase [Christensenellaceae bacterium]